jgi:hypothetical protein
MEFVLLVIIYRNALIITRGSRVVKHKFVGAKLLACKGKTAITGVREFWNGNSAFSPATLPLIYQPPMRLN